jgi:hypothetical protein
MAYFQYIPTTIVDFSEFGQDSKKYIISDIITNVRIKADLLKNLVYYEEYDIKDGETPEIISELFYGTSQYHWVLMLINEKYSYIDDFPLTQINLEAYIYDKYGEAQYDINHYESSDGYWVMSDYVNPNGVADATPITNYDYELQLNEAKRRMKIIPPNVLGDVIRQFREVLK